MNRQVGPVQSLRQPSPQAGKPRRASSDDSRIIRALVGLSFDVLGEKEALQFLALPSRTFGPLSRVAARRTVSRFIFRPRAKLTKPVSKPYTLRIFTSSCWSPPWNGRTIVAP